MNSERCLATTKKGKPCPGNARFNGYCKRHAKLPLWKKYRNEIIGIIIAVIVSLLFFIWDQMRSTKQVDELKQKTIQLKHEIGKVQDYLDGLPITSDIRKKKLLKNGFAARKNLNYDKARDLFRGILSLEPSPSERVAVLVLVGNTFSSQSKLQEAIGSYFEALSLAK